MVQRPVTLYGRKLDALMAGNSKNWKLLAIATSLPMLSVFFVNLSFNIGMQYAAELLPTVVRGQGVSFIHITG